MKFYTGAWIVGALAVIGVSAYLLYRHKRTEEDSRASEMLEIEDMVPARRPDEQDEVPTARVQEVKVEAAVSIADRHAEASRIASESIDKIFSEDDEEEVISENTQRLHEIGKELDDICG